MCKQSPQQRCQQICTQTSQLQRPVLWLQTTIIITDGWRLKTSLLAARARYARLTWSHSDHFSSLRHTHLYQTTPFQTAGTSKCFL